MPRSRDERMEGRESEGFTEERGRVTGIQRRGQESNQGESSGDSEASYGELQAADRTCLGKDFHEWVGSSHAWQAEGASIELPVPMQTLRMATWNTKLFLSK